MTVSTVKYRGNQGSNVPNTNEMQFSPNLWADCPLSEIRNGEVPGVFCESNGWADFPLAATQTTQIGHGKYKLFATSDGAISVVSAINLVEKYQAILKLTAGTTSDNESLSIAQSYPCFALTGSPSTSGPLWFEGQIAVSTIAVSTLGWFMGLAETEQWVLATGVPFNSGDAITNAASAIGFRKEEDGLGVVDTVYSDRATSFSNIGDAEGSMAANTLIKYGFKYDPVETDRCIVFYENGVELTTKFTRTNITDRTNLKANALGLLLAMVLDSSGDSTATYLARWRCFQLGPTY